MKEPQKCRQNPKASPGDNRALLKYVRPNYVPLAFRFPVTPEVPESQIQDLIKLQSIELVHTPPPPPQQLQQMNPLYPYLLADNSLYHANCFSTETIHQKKQRKSKEKYGIRNQTWIHVSHVSAATILEVDINRAPNSISQ